MSAGPNHNDARRGAVDEFESKVMCASIGLAIVSTALVPTAGGAEPQHGVCEQQVRDFVTGEIGHTIKSIDYWWSLHPGTNEMLEPSEALVYVNECPGFHLIAIRATGEECTMAHYGTPPDYLFYRGPSAGC